MKRTTLYATLTVAILGACSLQATRYCSLFDVDRLTSLFHNLGFSAFVVLVPWFFIMLSDAWGWAISFGSIRERITLRKLLTIRIATETLQISLPGGAAYAECVRPYLLKQHFGLEYPQSIAANIITKMNILLAQIMFLGCGLFLVAFEPSREPGTVPTFDISVAAIVVISLPLIFAYFLYRKSLLLTIMRLLQTSKLKIAITVLKKWRLSILEVNGAVSIFAERNLAQWVCSIVLFLLSWFLMACETLIILSVMRIEASISQVIIIESLISLVRIVFFFIPGAVGPQDVSLLFLFSLVGIPDPVNSSVLFTLLRRSKEFVWIIVGYALLISVGIRPRSLLARRKGMLTNPAAMPSTSEASG